MENICEFKRVTKWFPPGHLVFEKVDLTILAGEKMLITGYAGSGRTTLLQLAAGIVKPDEGEVKLFGSVAIVPEYTGAAVCICCIFICIYQEKLWLKQHYRWLEMLKQFYYDFHIYGKLMRRKYVILLGMSLLGSGIWQWLSMIFEW